MSLRPQGDLTPLARKYRVLALVEGEWVTCSREFRTWREADFFARTLYAQIETVRDVCVVSRSPDGESDQDGARSGPESQ